MMSNAEQPADEYSSVQSQGRTTIVSSKRHASDISPAAPNDSVEKACPPCPISLPIIRILYIQISKADSQRVTTHSRSHPACFDFPYLP